MKKYIVLFSIVLFGVYATTAQTPKGPMLGEDDNIVEKTAKSEGDFIKKYQLEGKKATTMKLLEEFEMRSAPSCESPLTEVVVSENSIVNVYRYFPKEQCWAANVDGEWGFLPGAILFPVSRHTMDMNRFDVAPKLRSRIKQKYPKQAEKKGITGTVNLKVYVDKHGKVTKTKVEKGIPELNQAAIDAIKDAKFKPAVYKNKNVGVWIPISFDFN